MPVTANIVYLALIIYCLVLKTVGFLTSFVSLSEIKNLTTPKPPLLFHSHDSQQSQKASSLFIIPFMNRSASLVCINTGEMRDLPEGRGCRLDLTGHAIVMLLSL